MKLKQSQTFTMMIVVWSTAAYPLMKNFEIWGLVGWFLTTTALAVLGSLAKSKEKALERASK